LNLNKQHLVVERKEKNVENLQDQKNAFGFCLYLLPCFIKTNNNKKSFIFLTSQNRMNNFIHKRTEKQKKNNNNVTYTYRSKKGWWQ
jgi:hypothetical protein